MLAQKNTPQPQPTTPKGTTKTISYVTQVLTWADDYAAFAEDCVSFRGKNGRSFRHQKPHTGQLRLRQIKETTTGADLWCVLKARQVGASSEIAAQLVHLALFTPGTSIAVAAQTERGVQGMSSLYGHIVRHLPQPLQANLFQAEIHAERIRFPRLNSEIVFGTANSESFRGTPRQAAHLTECAHFANLTKTLEALRPTVHGPLILESTANGPGDFHILWNDPHAKHIFISWKDDDTCQSDAPLPAPLTPQETGYVGRNQLDPKQASWFVHRLRQLGWESFQQEHPSNPSEAFRLGGDRYFQPAFFPTNIPPANQPFHQHLRPTPNRKYAIGADPASGSQSGDRSAFVVLDVTDPHNIQTAATFAGRLAPTEFGKQLSQVAKAYGNATVCVERNAGWGLSVLDILRKQGNRLYRTKVYDQIQKAYTDQFGWNTTATTRPLMLATLQEAIDSKNYQPKDPRLEEECNGFRYDKEGKPQAVSGCHDDLVIAAALALQAASQARSFATPTTPKVKLSEEPTLREIAEYEMATGELVDDEFNDTLDI